MNVCLISGDSATTEPAAATATALAAMGFRVVILYLQPPKRRPSTIPQIVHAPSGWDDDVLRILTEFRPAWATPLAHIQGAGGEAVRRAEWFTFRAFRFVSKKAAGGLGTVWTAVRDTLTRSRHDPLRDLPYGPGAYGVVHAFDAAALPVAEEASRRGGAVLVRPGVQDLRATYEAALRHWMKV